MTTGSSVGTNVFSGTVRLTVGAKILTGTAGLTPGTNITLATVGIQDTGRWTVGTLATGRRATGIGRMVPIMTVLTRGANTIWMIAGIRITGKRMVGVKRTSVTTIKTKSQWFTHAFFGALNVDQLVSSLQRGEESVTTFAGLEVDQGESFADTAAQSGIFCASLD